MAMCAHRHILVGGRMTISWHPCRCSASRFGGHDVVRCRDCEDAGLPADECDLWPAGCTEINRSQFIPTSQ
jgi:hypothetical protein